MALRPGGSAGSVAAGVPRHPRECRRGVARRAFLPERQELLARHRIDTPDGQRTSPDCPVPRRELTGPAEVSLRRLALPGAMEVPGERELRAPLLLLASGQHLIRADLFRCEPARPLAGPGADGREEGLRGSARQGDEQVRPELDVVRPDGTVVTMVPAATGRLGAYPHEGKHLTVNTEHPEGPAADEIVKRATELGVSLILMTTHGRSGLGRVVFGSTADSVLRHAPCPVLLVRVTDEGDDEESATG